MIPQTLAEESVWRLASLQSQARHDHHGLKEIPLKSLPNKATGHVFSTMRFHGQISSAQSLVAAAKSSTFWGVQWKPLGFNQKVKV